MLARPTLEELDGWYGLHTGVGLVCGTISRRLEMIEFEGRAVKAGCSQAFLALAREMGLADLVERIRAGYQERTPSGGLHLLYHVPTPRPNTKLATRPATADELAQDPDDRVKVLIETRGEGGYTIVAPSNGSVHPCGGSWALERGGFDSIATISDDERDALFALARMLDEMPPVDTWPHHPAGTRTSARATATTRHPTSVSGRWRSWSSTAGPWSTSTVTRGTCADRARNPPASPRPSATSPRVCCGCSAPPRPSGPRRPTHPSGCTRSSSTAVTSAPRRVPSPRPSASTSIPSRAEDPREMAPSDESADDEDRFFLSPAQVYDGAPPVEWVVPGMVARGAITNLDAKPKTGKTTLALMLVAAALDPVAALPGHAGRVRHRHLPHRAGPRLVQGAARRGGHRARRRGAHRDRALGVGARQGLGRGPGHGPRRVEARLAEARVLLVVDTFSKWSRIADENDATAAMAAYRPLVLLTQDLRLATLVLRHARKGEHDDVTDTARGSNAASGEADIILSLVASGGPTRRGSRHPGPARRGPPLGHPRRALHRAA